MQGNYYAPRRAAGPMTLAEKTLARKERARKARRPRWGDHNLARLPETRTHASTWRMSKFARPEAVA